MSDNQNHAIVFGAAGLLGWSVVNQLLSNYPEAGTFSKVTAVINRPVAEKDFYWPGEGSGRPQLQIVPGVNLLEGTGEDLAAQLKGKVGDVGGITHVFYYVFSSFDGDHVQECNLNCDMMQRVADAMNIVAPSLTSFVYSGGTRGYGIYVPGGTFKAPLTESMADNLPEDYAKTVAYPWFRQILTKASQDRAWTWTEVCPDAVVGFSPNGSGYSLALHWAQYLSLYAYNHGIRRPGDASAGEVRVAFPGNEETLDALFTPVSDQTLGRSSIHASLNPNKCSRQILNIADNDTPSTFRALWPSITSWFGLTGVGPSADPNALKTSEYITKHKHIFVQKGRPKALSCGVGAGSSQLDSVGWWLTFDRQLSLERLRGTGFEEVREARAGWVDAFERFRAAGIIL